VLSTSDLASGSAFEVLDKNMEPRQTISTS